MSDDNTANLHLQSVRESMQMPPVSYIDVLPFSTSDETMQCRHRRRCRRYYSTRSASFLLLMLCYTAAVSCRRSHAFSSPPLSRTTCQFTSGTAPSKTSNFMSFVAEIPADPHAYSSPENKPSNKSPGLTDFQRRMKGLVKRNGAAQRDATEKPANLKTVHTLLDYKKALDEGSDKIVVVRFFATWCKACKAIQPSFYRMASLYPHVLFLEVPVTNENANLHQGLGVPSLPYGHIYYPNAGLVEELKISKKYFHRLVNMVRWYDVGACDLDEYVPDSDENGESS
ncbi:hypothetical protein HJC23_011805 [Cyclotella cryptica]|uniref:Thioredoxin domain-containing protein n=1 Tax=Cyclotella cryptica TaxID=29204 RepID=A0ABD3PIT5_9STRA